MNSALSKEILLVTGAGVLAILIIVGLIFFQAGDDNLNPQIEVTQDRSTISSNEVEEAPDEGETPNPINNPSDFIEEVPPENSPENWHLLTDRQKISLNPHNCPADENGLVHIRNDNGHCLTPKAVTAISDKPPELPAVDDEKPTDLIVTNDNFISFGQPFTYNQSLEVTIKSLSCQNSNEDTNSTNSQYSTDFSRLSTKSRYTVSNESPSTLPNVDQRCSVVISGQNIGADRYLPDGCGLSFDRNVNLKLTGQQKQFQSTPNDLLCTKNIIDFPYSASNKDTVLFILESQSEIKEIIFKNINEYILPVTRAKKPTCTTVICS